MLLSTVHAFLAILLFPLQIIVEGVSGNSYTGDIAIDDFKVNSGVSCQTTPALLVGKFLSLALLMIIQCVLVVPSKGRCLRAVDDNWVPDEF